MPLNYLLKENNPQNDANLIRILEGWLNSLNIKKLNVADDGVFDKQTRLSVIQFQTLYNVSPANGVVGVATWNALAKRVGAVPLQAPLVAPDWLTRLQNQRTKVAVGKIKVDRALFTQMYAEAFGASALKQAVGLASVLDFIGEDEKVDDIRWAAYMLATTKHETGHNYMPVREIGRGATHDYGQNVTVECGGKKYTHIFYGRGYVQLTRGGNYVNMSQELYQNCKLVADPDLVMVPQTAYEIMSYGMRLGRFRGHLIKEKTVNPKTHKPVIHKHRDPYSLDDYFNDNTTDYFNARAIINGDKNHVVKGNPTSNGHLIEGYALKFEGMLRACLVN